MQEILVYGSDRVACGLWICLYFFSSSVVREPWRCDLRSIFEVISRFLGSNLDHSEQEKQ